jgi:hypothetical protein
MNTFVKHIATANPTFDVGLLHNIIADRRTFTESIDVKACKYISSLTLENFKDAFCIGEWKEENGATTCADVRTYQRRINALCIQTMAKAEPTKTKYKYGKSAEFGRLYVDTCGVQSLSKPLRDLMVPSTMVDYDMVNAHPSILLFVYRAMSLPTHFLAEYVSDRENVLQKTGKDKSQMLVMLNKDYNNPQRECDWVKGFVTELKQNKAAIFDVIEDAYRTTKKVNVVSSSVNRLMCDIENRLLQTAMHAFVKDTDHCVPMFDGFMVNREIDVGALGALTETFGVTWKIKDWQKSSVPAEFDENQGTSYAAVKLQFEEDHFIVRKPLMWSAHGKFVPKADFMDLAAEYQYKNEKGNDTGIFPKWLSDKTKRSYASVTCVPFNPLQEDTTPDDVFNEAIPMSFDYVAKDERNQTALDDFKYIIEHLTNTEEEQNYLVRWVADILQNPATNPQVIVVIKGHYEGAGKDTLMKTILQIIGSTYVSSVDDMDMVFGAYNPALDRKLLLQFNEAQSSQGVKFNDKIKNLVTQDTNTIKQKYEKDKQQPNYVRPVVTSNHGNPLIAQRRTFICQSRIDIVISKEWWTEYYTKKINNAHFINSLASDLLDIDLSDFDVKKPPQTEVQKNKLSDKVSDCHRFLQKLVEGGFSAPDVFEIPKKTGMIGCTFAWMKKAYSNYLHDHNTTGYAIEPTKAGKDLKLWANEYVKSISLQGKATIDGKQIRCVIVDTALLCTSLKNGGMYTYADEFQNNNE